MRMTYFPFPIQSSDLARAACIARQIQNMALGGADGVDFDVMEALAEALAYRLERSAAKLEGAGHE